VEVDLLDAADYGEWVFDINVVFVTFEAGHGDLVG
jgi:hypothetical protein